MRSAPLVIAIVLSTAPLYAGADGDARLDEYQVKAAFLYNFAKFVEWPRHAGRDALVLGIVGGDRVTSVVEAVVKGRSAHGRRFEVRSIRAGEDPRGCDMLFITIDEDRQAADLVRRTRDAGVLTVGEGDRFLEDGGIIRFVADGKRVRFHINAARAQQAGLTISSHLLSLALP